MKNKVALVTDLKVIDSPQAGIGIARCLKAKGMTVIGADYTESVTRQADLMDHFSLIEEIKTLNIPSLISKIKNLQKIKGLNIIMPGYDETAVLFSAIRNHLPDNISVICPPLETLKAIDKRNLDSLIDQVGLAQFQCPISFDIKSFADLDNSSKALGFPCVVKGKVKGASICNNISECKIAATKQAKMWNNGEMDLILQEYIQGEMRNAVIGFNKGSLVAYAEMVKLGIDMNGATWLGKLVPECKLLSFAELISKHYNFGNSIIEIETISRDGVFHIYEINPRSPAWIEAIENAGLPIFTSVLYGSKSIQRISREVNFGRGSYHFINNVQIRESPLAASKGAGYKTDNLAYPSDIFL